MAACGSALTLSERLAPGIVGRVWRGWNVCPRSVPTSQCGPGRVRPPLACLRVGVFVPIRGCPLPLVNLDTGSRGGLFLPQSESGGESGRPAAAGEQVRAPRRGCRARGGAAAGAARRGNSAGAVASSVWAEELCLPLTVCLCALGEAGAESVGTGEGFRGDSRSPTRSLNQTSREGFVPGAGGIRAGWPGASVCLACGKFARRGRLCAPGAPGAGPPGRGGRWVKVNDQGPETRWFRES